MTKETMTKIAWTVTYLAMSALLWVLVLENFC